MLKLYRAPFSTNVERVALALAYKGLEGESVWIDYSDRTPVEEVSGQSLVPVLVDGERVVADSPQILLYLEELKPDPPLYPDDAARREEMLVFIDWFNYLWKVWPSRVFDGVDVEDHVAALRASLDRFDALLDGRDHLMGDDFSAADCVVFPFLKYGLLAPEPGDDERFHAILQEYLLLGDEHPRIADWIRRVDQRPRA